MPPSWNLLPPEQWTHNVAFQWAPQLWRRALLHSQEVRREEVRRSMEDGLVGDLGAAWNGLLLGMLSQARPDPDAAQSPETNAAATELDMYERFLDGLRPSDAKAQSDTHAASTQIEAAHPPPSQIANPRPTPPVPATAAADVGVVATLTTTEHVVLPDGTTRTTVALRKRFVDGREERKETVQTSQGQHGSGGTESGQNGEAEGGERKGKGWFWS